MSPPLPNELPDEFVRITDDVHAQAFLLAEGLLDKLPSHSGLAKDFPTEINTVIVKHLAHAIHWILACRFHGSEDAKENGFVVMAWPKKKYDASILEKAVGQMNPDNEKFDGIKVFKDDWKTPFS